MQCVILAGGLGTRMYPITASIPKALIPVAGAPFIDHQLRWISAHGVSDVVLCVGHLGEMIEEHVGAGAQHGLTVRYVREGSALRGTAGALRLAYDEGALDEAFLVTYGDSYLPIDFDSVSQAFSRSEKPALMTVFRNEGLWDDSNVVFDPSSATVVLYDKTRATRPASDFQFIDFGLLGLQRDVLARLVPQGAKRELAELLRSMSVQGDVAGYEVTQRFYEVGSSAGLADLERFLRGH